MASTGRLRHAAAASARSVSEGLRSEVSCLARNGRQPRGRKFKRSSCGKACEAQPSPGQTAIKRDPAWLEREGRTGENAGGKGGRKTRYHRSACAMAGHPGHRRPPMKCAEPAATGAGAGTGISRAEPTETHGSRDLGPLPGIHHHHSESGSIPPTGVPAREQTPAPDPCAPPGGGAARRARSASRIPSQTSSTPRSGQQRGHSRKRPAGRAACARACGPAAALTPAVRVCDAENQKRATSGGAAKRRQCALR
jgi:hypothetical protein